MIERIFLVSLWYIYYNKRLSSVIRLSVRTYVCTFFPAGRLYNVRSHARRFLAHMGGADSRHAYSVVPILSPQLGFYTDVWSIYVRVYVVRITYRFSGKHEMKLWLCSVLKEKRNISFFGLFGFGFLGACKIPVFWCIPLVVSFGLAPIWELVPKIPSLEEEESGANFRQTDWVEVSQNKCFFLFDWANKNGSMFFSAVSEFPEKWKSQGRKIWEAAVARNNFCINKGKNFLCNSQKFTIDLIGYN